jgi:RNA-directed DNA polymerase
MVRHRELTSESWKQLPWKKFQKTLFRLQVRLYKAMRANDRKRALSLQRLILRSASARFLAIRQVSQLNAGKKTAGIDGQKNLTTQARFELERLLHDQWQQWQPAKLRHITIPKPDGSRRILKIPTLRDRAWQKLMHYALEPAHEATFHARSYGFRPGRSTHDAQQMIFANLRSYAHGREKTILELDIEKCFDRIDHSFLMQQVILPQCMKQGLWRLLKRGVTPEYPNQGTPQGGIVSPTLANIALNGIESLGSTIIRYADDLVAILKPGECPQALLARMEDFLAQRGLNVKQAKTHIVAATNGFDFLGWHFRVKANGKYDCTPTKANYQNFRRKVKAIVNNSQLSARTKTAQLAPLVKGWRQYHQFCRMQGKPFSLWYLNHRTWQVFNRQVTLNRDQVNQLVKRAFPAVPARLGHHQVVKADASVFNGDFVYWSQRHCKRYQGNRAKLLKQQHHQCGYCGLQFIGNELIQLHHQDGNHHNWKLSNLMMVHEFCHDLIHRKQAYGLDYLGAGCGETRTSGSEGEVRSGNTPTDSN